MRQQTYRSPIPTVQQLRRDRRRLDRRRQRAEFVLRAMRRGNALHLCHTRNGSMWTLSDGQRVDADIEAMVACDANVVPVGDGLSGANTSQTWRWIGD